LAIALAALMMKTLLLKNVKNCYAPHNPRASQLDPNPILFRASRVDANAISLLPPPPAVQFLVGKFHIAIALKPSKTSTPKNAAPGVLKNLEQE
jgi:hypothetical protein